MESEMGKDGQLQPPTYKASEGSNGDRKARAAAQQEELRQPINDQGQGGRATGTLRAWQWEVTGQERMVQGQQELRE